MSGFSFSSVNVEAKATQRGISVSSPSGDVSESSAVLTAHINLPENLKAKINFNDKTASSVRVPARGARRARAPGSHGGGRR